VPDKYGFEHLAQRGDIFHRCVECDEFPFGTRLTEKERERHHRQHARALEREREKKRMAALRLARQAKREYRG